MPMWIIFKVQVGIGVLKIISAMNNTGLEN